MVYQSESTYNKIIKGFSFLWIIVVVLVSSVLMISSNITKVPVTVRLTSLFDNDNSVVSTVNSNLGDTISITPPGQINDYEFVFWVINGIVNPNYGLNHSFVVQSELELQAVFSKPDKRVVLFVDSNGKLLSHQYVLPHSSITDPYESLTTKPTKPGLIVKEAPNRWLSHNGTSMEFIDAHTVFTLQYEVVNTDTYSILVDSGVILNEAPYHYNDLITVEAVNKPEETFSYWLKDGAIVSYEKLYRFTAVQDTSLTAVYNRTEPDKNVLVNQSNDLKLRNDYYTYMTSFALKEGYDLVEFGYLFHPESATELTLDLEGIIKFQMSQYNPSSNEYVASFPLGSHQSMRSYLIVRNSFKELEVHYSNQVNNPYEVNFYDENGINLLDTVYVAHGEIPFTNVVPFKASTAEHSYEFSGWNKALIPIYSNTNYYASFSSIPTKYEVTFVIDDFTQIIKTVPYNAYIEPIEDPVTDDIFIGWEGLPTIMPANDITVYAKFISGNIGRFATGTVPNWIKGSETAVRDTFVDSYITAGFTNAPTSEIIAIDYGESRVMLYQVFEKEGVIFLNDKDAKAFVTTNTNILNVLLNAILLGIYPVDEAVYYITDQGIYVSLDNTNIQLYSLGVGAFVSPVKDIIINDFEKAYQASFNHMVPLGLPLSSAETKSYNTLNLQSNGLYASGSSLKFYYTQAYTNGYIIQGQQDANVQHGAAPILTDMYNKVTSLPNNSNLDMTGAPVSLEFTLGNIRVQNFEYGYVKLVNGNLSFIKDKVVDDTGYEMNRRIGSGESFTNWDKPINRNTYGLIFERLRVGQNFRNAIGKLIRSNLDKPLSQQPYVSSIEDGADDAMHHVVHEFDQMGVVHMSTRGSGASVSGRRTFVVQGYWYNDAYVIGAPFNELSVLQPGRDNLGRPTSDLIDYHGVTYQTYEKGIIYINQVNITYQLYGQEYVEWIGDSMSINEALEKNGLVENEVKVTFLNYYGEEIESKYITVGDTLNAIDIPVAPTLVNLDFVGWSYGIDRPISSTNNVFVAVYYSADPVDYLVEDELNGYHSYGLDLFNQIDYLPKLFNHLSSEQQSSYSRDGGNADGFGTSNHAGSNITGEPNEQFDPQNRILLQLNQPGVVYRMWFTSWDLKSPLLKIYIDGEETPTYEVHFDTIGTGTQDPFTGALVFDQQSSSGGIVSYTPIVFKKSIKIVGSEYFYYNINYQKYPQGTVLEYEDYQTKLSDVNNMLANVGSDPKNTSNDQVVTNNFSLNANETKTIYESFNKQTVTALTLNFNDFLTRKFDRNEHVDIGISANTTVSFNVDVVPNVENKLVFKGVLKAGTQTASLKIDNVNSGNLIFRARRLDGFEWRESDYFYDQTITLPISSKSSVKVTIGSGVEIYNVRVTANGSTKDSVDFGDTTSRANHGFTGGFSSVTKSLEYDPNYLIDSATWNEIYQEEDIINQVYLKITYPDMGVAVNAPVSSFFGFGAFGMFETLSLMVGLKQDGTMYSYYPMPFEAGIKIELINHSNYNFSQVTTTTSYENNLLTFGDYGYFKAHYVANIHQTPTALKEGEPITFIEVGGRGLIAGITHSMSAGYNGEHSRFYLEGDEQIYIDGSMSHSLHGTGTEDFYNGGWYFKTGVQTNPLFGQSNHNYRDNRDRTVMLRTFITDPIYFRNGIDFKMEHGGWNSSEQADVFGVVYYYHLSEPSMIETDRFNLANQTDIDRVNYQPGSNSTLKTMPNGAKYEGYYNGQLTPYNKYYELKTGASFNVNIDLNNNGVILRREYLLKHIGQKANVYVDGQLVGIWHSSFRNAYDNYVRQDDFFIPESFTKDKQNITITIEVLPNNESIVWTESMYQVFSVMD